MAHEIYMPKFGQTVEEAEIVKWHVGEGDTVTKGDVLLEIQTDKATLEVESFHSGTILKLYPAKGDSVPVMSVIGYIGESGEKVPDTQPPVPELETKKAAAPASSTQKSGTEKQSSGRQSVSAEQTAAPSATVPLAVGMPPAFSITPRAKKRAEDACIDYKKVQGSGPSGRIIEKDILRYLEQNNYDTIRITPVAKNILKEYALDILEIRGTGTHGKITKEDVERAVAARPKPMSAMRKIVATRMSDSFHTMPHFFVTYKIDVTELLAFRKEARREKGLKASVNDYILKAAAVTLREFPVVNSTCLGDTYRENQDVNIGFAVALTDGLIVPVVQKADTLSMEEIAESSKSLATRARSNKLTPEEYRGGTFTISNMGMLGVDEFTAIINPGESAILAVGNAVDTPVVLRGEIVIRTIMKMTLSSDHRIIDGAVSATFMKALKSKLEDISFWQKIV